MLVNGVRRLQKDARAEDPVPPGATHSRCSENACGLSMRLVPGSAQRGHGGRVHIRPSAVSDAHSPLTVCPVLAPQTQALGPAPPPPPCDVTPFLLHPTCISAPTTRAGPLECPPSWDHTEILGRGGRELRNPLMAPPAPSFWERNVEFANAK